MTDLCAYGIGGRQPALHALNRALARVPIGGLVAASVAWLVVVTFARPDAGPLQTGLDAISYWAPRLDDPYAQADWTTIGAYVYSPAFLQLVSPLHSLSWLEFMGVWTAVLLVAVRFLTGPHFFALGVLLASAELIGGNISLLLAAAIVIGFRWPAAWALILLTKVTPGIGLLWFAVRGEWRNLSIALGATAALFAISAAMMASAWADWVGVLLHIAGRDPTWAAVPIPFLIRLPLAIAIVTWGARTDRRWTVPVACMLALPALWYGGLTMLLAIIALQDRGIPAASGERASAPDDGADLHTRRVPDRPDEPRGAY